MKKTFLMLVLALISVSLSAQYFTIGEDVQSYSQGISEAQAFVNSELRKGYDITFPANERILRKATPKDAAQGNIGYDFHGIPQIESVLDNSDGRVAFIIVDDCAGYTHSAIRWIPELAKNFTGEPASMDALGKHSHHVGGITSGYKQGVKLGIAGNLNRDDRAAVVPLKALTTAGSGFYSWISSASYYAAELVPILKDDYGFDHVVINYSLGGSSPSPAVDAALKACRDAGAIIYAANGNTGTSPVNFPGSSQYTEGVAALKVNSNGTASRAYYSSTGPETTLAGVGSDVYSCQPDEGYAIFNGTSMASPMVAGVAGVSAAIDPEQTDEEIISAVRGACTDISPKGKDNETGFGYPYAPDLVGGGDNPDNPDNPDPTPDPDPEPEPEPEPEPDFSSTIVHEIDGQKLTYHTTTNTTRRQLKIDDMLVTVTSAGNSDAVYDFNQDWTESYFKRITMVIPEDPTWGHCENTYWAGQFYEYWSRNDAIGAQVQVVRGEDAKGRNCMQFDFNRASKPAISVYYAEKGRVVLTAVTSYGVVSTIIRPERKGLRRFLFGR